MPRNFYNQSLGFFCKKEVQLQKATGLPLFIRLGSKEYVDYLEKKPNARTFLAGGAVNARFWKEQRNTLKEPAAELSPLFSLLELKRQVV